MVYRLNSISASLDGDRLMFDNGSSMWLITYLAGNNLPHSTEDSFKIGEVVKYYDYTWHDIEEEARLIG